MTAAEELALAVIEAAHANLMRLLDGALCPTHTGRQ